MKTRQELFNLAWRGLKAQGWAQSAANGKCLYRDPTGRKCAIGHCIPDELYTEAMDACMNGIDDNYLAADAAGIAKEDLRFARYMQIEHDEALGDMRKRFIGFAKQYSLTIPD